MADTCTTAYRRQEKHKYGYFIPSYISLRDSLDSCVHTHGAAAPRPNDPEPNPIPAACPLLLHHYQYPLLLPTNSPSFSKFPMSSTFSMIAASRSLPIASSHACRPSSETDSNSNSNSSSRIAAAAVAVAVVVAVGGDGNHQNKKNKKNEKTNPKPDDVCSYVCSFFPPNPTFRLHDEPQNHKQKLACWLVADTGERKGVGLISYART